MAKFSRKTYDQKTKDRIVDAVIGGSRTVAEVSKDAGVQPYQVLAWIGERAIADATKPLSDLPKSADDTARGLAALPDFAADLTDPDLARAIGEWWIKTHLLGRAGKR